jgi:hypothetical protein
MGTISELSYLRTGTSGDNGFSGSISFLETLE